ncbi:hypothetical protein PSHT_11141 [Puccinia striiformis]|uniref:HAT C-terminal dimerisation domain-containing protein n=1 Tax=Puccinia striiformis TaxID=27350 RepID=A0A2S4V587_9BASI|nr:hypothetical protein PSHT_11141 [Puccinia striiformis]
MARRLQILLPSFNASTNLLGCVAHVINLGAKAGMVVLRGIEDDGEEEEISMVDNDSDKPHPSRLTPQCREQFREVVGFAQPDLRDSGARLTTLKIDVSTRWNSTFEMFERAIQLRRSCDHCCEENTETRPYLLSPSEGDQAANVMNLLQPLSEATTLLCGSHYPTINKALPIYIVLMKHLKQIEHNLYNQSQLIQPATQIITKLEQYLLAALIKPVYICAMILDPTFKTQICQKNKAFLEEYYKLSVNIILVTFREAARQLEPKDTTTQPTPSTSSGIAKKPSLSSSELHGPVAVLEAEIDCYLKEDLKPEKTDAPSYWAVQQKNYPVLSKMARRFLAVPATSAASERVSSRGRQIVSWQRSSLDPVTIKQLLCLKKWYQLINSPL